MAGREEFRADFVVGKNEIPEEAEKAAKAIDNLNGEDAVIVLSIQAAQVQQVLTDIAHELATIDGDEAKVSVLVARANEARQELNQIKQKIVDVDGETATVKADVDDKATPKLREVERAADRVDKKTATVKVDSTGISEAESALGNMGGSMGAITGAMQTGVGQAGALAAALGLAVNEATDLALEAQTTATLTGASVEEASRLQAVWQTSGANANDLNDVLLQMNGVLQTDAAVAKQLGVNLNDGKTVTERFVQVMGILDKSTLGASEKAQLMSRIFGEEGVRQVGKLVAIVGDDLQAAMDGVAETKVVDEADVAQAVELTKQFQEIKTAVTGIAVELGKAVGPAAGDAAAGASDLLGILNDIKDIDLPGGFKLGDILSPVQLGPRLYGKLRDAINGTNDAIDVFAGGEFKAAGAADALTARLEHQAGMLKQHTADVDKATAARVKNVDATIEAIGDLGDTIGEIRDILAEPVTIGDIVDSVTAVHDEIFALKNISMDYEQALEDMNTALDENGASFDLSTEAGRANEQALQALGGTLIPEMAANYERAGGSLQAFGEMQAETAGRLKQSLIDNGVNAKQAQEIVDRLVPLDDVSIQTQFELTGADLAAEKVEQLIPLLSALNLSPDIMKQVAVAIASGQGPEEILAIIQSGLDAGAMVPVGADPSGAVSGVAGVIGAVGGGLYGTASIPTELMAPAVDAGPFTGGAVLNIPPVSIPSTLDSSGAAAAIDAVVTAAYGPATVTTDADTGPANTTVNSFIGVPRSTTIETEANTAPAETAINTVVTAKRTAKVDVATGTITMPSAKDLADKIGAVRVPVDYYIRTDARVDGSP